MGGFLTETLHYPRNRNLPKSFISVMRMLSMCPHANVGWPIRCSGEKMPSQHCFDCGAQRTYILQPRMQKGPWKYAQLSSTFPIRRAATVDSPPRESRKRRTLA
jgi:hypothetical protein